MAKDIRPARRILTDLGATNKLDAGVALVGETVGMTMGPKGKNVVIRLGRGAIGEGKVVSTKDGVFVANQISHHDPEVDLGVEMAVEASRKTNDAAGDGTTATVVLLDAMVQEARKELKTGRNPILIQQGMELEKDMIVQFIKDSAKPVQTDDEIYNVALVSCQDKDIARKITDIVLQVGKLGAVSVESQTGPLSIALRVVRGMYFDIGYNPQLTSLTAASAMGQLQRKGSSNALVWDNADVGVLIFDEPIRLWTDVAHIFNACMAADRRKLLIIADFHDDAVANMLAQYQQGVFTGCVISRSVFGGDAGREILKDIAIYCGAMFLSPSEGNMPNKNQKITNIETVLGSCTVSASMNTFSLSQGRGTQDDIDGRIAFITRLMEEGALDAYAKQKSRERIARFSAGLGTVTIIAPTEVQQQSLRTRVDDALCAVRSANEEGIVVGGGVALLRCHQWLKMGVGPKEDKDIAEGRRIVCDALLAPARKIAEMAGEDPVARLAQLMSEPWESSMGFNYWTAQEMDLMKGGIIDPAKVVRMCVENAVSSAGEILRAGATIVDLPDNAPEEVYLTPRERALEAHERRIAKEGPTTPAGSL